MKFEIPEYDLSKVYSLKRMVESKQNILDTALAPSNRNGEVGRRIQSEIDEMKSQIADENKNIKQCISEFEKKYPGYSLEIYNNEEFVVFNKLLMDTAEMIKNYYRSKKIKMHPLTSELKQLKDNLTKILSDSVIVKNISESTYNELSEINDEVREELEIRANHSDSPFKWFEKSMKDVHRIKKSIK